MSDVESILLTAGKPLATGALAGFSAFGPTKFRVGAAANFAPNAAATDIRGSLVFEGKSGLMQTRMVAADTVRYTLTIPENYGPFDIGNVVMYASAADGKELPVVHVILPFAVSKMNANVDLDSASPYPIPGSRFVINITIKHSMESEIVKVQVISPNFSSLPTFDTQMNLPPSAVNPWQQAVIQNDTRLNTPTLISKAADGDYWGIPFWQNLRSPKYGVISGGSVGDGHKEDNSHYLFGYYYLTLNSDLAGILGGTGYKQDNDLGFVGVVGGVPYKKD